MNTSRPISKSRPSGAIPLLASIAVAAEAALPFAAHAATGVTVDSVTQRWPWNNKLDITYTVTGGQDVASGQYCKIVFTTVIDGTTYTIDGTTDVPASAASGTHTITWDAPEGVRRTDCTMSAAVYATDVPSGDDYMVIDLNTGVVTWEGMLASQADSNARYNTDTYKTTKMVLRKVPKTADSASLPNGPFTSGYPTGDADHPTQANITSTPKNWTTDRDYYIGVFPVTQGQISTVYGGWNPSQRKDDIAGNVTAHRPAETISWTQLRSANLKSTDKIASIAAVDGNSSFFQRLMLKTGNKFAFDLPTEVMFEIAERAGATTYYYWGNTMDTSYVVCSENSGGSTVAVGSRLPNAWGLYDTCGNVNEWMLDERGADELANHVDAFKPAYQGNSNRFMHGGGHYNEASSSGSFYASNRGNYSAVGYSGSGTGFRVSYVRQ